MLVIYSKVLSSYVTEYILIFLFVFQFFFKLLVKKEINFGLNGADFILFKSLLIAREN